jgi:hypothetical protein
MFDINELNNEIAVIGSRVNISCLARACSRGSC